MYIFHTFNSIFPLSIKDLRNLKSISSDGVFIALLIIKVILLLSFHPLTHINWFIPFLKDSLNDFSLIPWNNFLNNDGNSLSFPYGISMWIAYLPLTSLGWAIDKVFSINFFTFIGFKLTSLLFDYFTLISLAFLTNFKRIRLLIVLYWSSPLVIYINFFHGQLDVFPVMIMLASICLIRAKQFIASGLFLAIAVSSKFSIIVALPFIIIYLQRRQGIGNELIKFVAYFFSGLILLTIPFFFSSGYYEMVINTREIQKIYSVYLPFGNLAKVYLVPLIYLINIYCIWRLDRITLDLFLVSTGLSFFILLIFIPPSPGWLMWIIPFLVYYEVKAPRNSFILSPIFSIVVLLNNIQISTGSVFVFTDFAEQFNPEFYKATNYEYVNNFLFTIQQSLSALFSIRMFNYGIKRNNFYKNDKPILILLKGSNTSIENNVLNFLMLLGKNNAKVIKASTLLKSFSKSDLSKELFNSNFDNMSKSKLSFSSEVNLKNKINNNKISKIFYYKNINNILKYFQNILEKRSQYIFLLDDLKSMPISLENKIDLFISFNDSSCNEKKLYRNDQTLKRAINYEIIPFGSNLNYSDSIKDKLNTLSCTMRSSFLYTKLTRLIISISPMHIDSESINNGELIKMIFEGESDNGDIKEIASNLIPELEDLNINHNFWSSGYQGIMQIIFLANISEILQRENITL